MKIGIPLEAPRVFAGLNKMLLEENPDDLLIPTGHSQGGLVLDRSFAYFTIEELNRMNIVTVGSATMIENRHLNSVINCVSVGDPIPFVTDPLSIFKMAITFDRRVYFNYSYCPLYDHSVSSPVYSNTLENL